jgi:hypothetical protein
MDGTPPQTAPAILLEPRRSRSLTGAALFLMILGARLWLIGAFGSDVPFWDQWDCEAANLYKKIHDGTLSLSGWLAPHNEHRIFFTRILAYGLLLANGQWDPRLQMEVNALLFAATACGLFLILSKGRRPRFALLCGTGLAILFSLPYGWENTLTGLGSQYCSLLAFSLAALYLLLSKPAGSWRWTLCAASGAAALLSMASGLFAPLAILATLSLATLRQPSRWREQLRGSWKTAAVCVVLVLAGWATSVTVGYHAQHYQAHSLSAFLRAWAACLSWPCGPLEPLWSIVSWSPFAVMLHGYATRRIEDGPPERFVLGLGLWVVLQAAAIAFGRASIVHEPRYADILSFGLIVNALSAARLVGRRTKRYPLILSMLVVGLLINGLCLLRLSFHGAVSGRSHAFRMERSRTAGFVATGDFRYLDPVTQPWDIPYPDPKRLAGILLDPAIRPILPVGVRQSLQMVPAEASAPASAAGPGMPTPDELLNHDLGDVSWAFTHSIVIPYSGRFAYRVEKTRGLPYLFLSFFGEKGNRIAVLDSRGVEHRLIALASQASWLPHNAFARCPTDACTIVGLADGARIVLLEPKEVGALSLGALLAGQAGYYLFTTGALLLLTLLIAVNFVKA